MAIDKIDKIGIDAVNAELIERGLSNEAVETLRPILSIDGPIQSRLEQLDKILANSEVGKKGVEELRFIVEATEKLGLGDDADGKTNTVLDLDVSLARGLNYYTGTIIEVKALDVQIGSITGGGRYDNLTGVFGMPGVSGVGISFGADRIYDVLNTLDLYPSEASDTTKVLFITLGDAYAIASLKAIKRLRASNISAELYPDSAKMKKQMAYANALAIPFVAIIGESELTDGTVTLKNMSSGEQSAVAIDELPSKIML